MIGEARAQMDEAVGELEQAKASIQTSKQPLDGAVDALRRQANAKTDAVPVAAAVIERITGLQASIGALGALLMDGKIASQDMHTTSVEADTSLRDAYSHAARARQLIANVTGEEPNEGTTAANNIKGIIGTNITLIQTGEASIPHFGSAVEKVQEMLATLAALATTATEVAGSIPQLGYRGGDVELYLADVPFYAEETAIGIDQGIQSIQDRTSNW